MSRFSNLIALSTIDDAVPSGVGKMADVVQKALAKHKEEKEQAAGTEILEALRMVESTKNDRRRNIKRLRTQMKEQTDALDALDRAAAYGQETSNFLPLLHQLHVVDQYSSGMETKEFAEAVKVPESFKSAQ